MAIPQGDVIQLTGDPYIDGLVQGSAWQLAPDRRLTYSFHMDPPVPYETWLWTSASMGAMRSALATWSAVANLQFAQVSDPQALYQSNADMAFSLYRDPWNPNLVALGFFPDPAFVDQVLAESGLSRADYPKPEGDVFMNYSSGVMSYLQRGALGYWVLIHELGHALGLKQPFDDGGNGRPTFTQLGIGSYDDGHWTVMSYDDTNPYSLNYGHAMTPMPLDILAIQHIYGPNMSYHTGNDVYHLVNGQIWTIWDAGGTDTIDASALSSSIELHLEGGTVNYFGYPGAIGIAFNVTIENAIGSRYNDTLVGNSADNILVGGAGNDTVTGGAGNDQINMLVTAGNVDTIDAGDGTDTLVLSGVVPGNHQVVVDLSSTTDQVSSIGGAPNSESLVQINFENLNASGLGGALNATGSDVDNVIIGSIGNDTLTGGSGNDTLNGGFGADNLIGGADNDTYVIDNPGDQITELSGGGIADTVQINRTVDLNVAPFTEIENVVLIGTAAINATGDSGDNQLTGNSAANVLTGGDGNDTLIGGAGNDTYVVNDQGDVVVETSPVATEVDLVRSAVSFDLSDSSDGNQRAQIENLTLTGTATVGTGNAKANTIIGNDAANVLDGQGGLDTLKGGKGDDTYHVDLAKVGTGATATVKLEDIITESLNQGLDTVILRGVVGDLVKATTLTVGANLEQLDASQTAGTKLNLTGNVLNNTLTGNDGDNLLAGLAGNDQLNGGAGNDILDGGVGTDDLAGGTGDDTYVIDNLGDSVTEASNEGSDTVKVTYSNSTATVATLSLNPGLVPPAPTGAQGLAGLVLGAGVAGLPLLTLAVAAPDKSFTEVENLSVTGTGLFNLVGSEAGNVLTGNSAGNVLWGLGGNDTLAGGAGNDTLIGGDGNDLLILDTAADVVVENSDEGSDTVRVAYNVTMPTLIDLTSAYGGNVENVQVIGSGAFNLTGNDAADSLTGNASNNILIGGAGNDQLTGGAGADTLRGGEGEDLFVLNTPGDFAPGEQIDGGDGTDTLRYTGTTAATLILTNRVTSIEEVQIADAAGGASGTAAINVTAAAVANGLIITSNDGDNVLTGTAQTDTITGNGGNDILTGGAGDDTLLGGDGNDVFMIGSPTDHGTGEILTGGAGDDVIRFASTTPGQTLVLAPGVTEVERVVIGTAAGVTTGTTALNVDASAVGSGLSMIGNAGANVLTGTAFDDGLTGNAGNDQLIGGAGNDQLTGGAGADTLRGGEGEDLFVLNTPGDFAPGEQIDGGDGTDTLRYTGNTAATLILTNRVTNIEQVEIADAAGGASGTAAINIDAAAVGSGLIISGNDGDNVFTGTAFDDTIGGNAGNDVFVIGNATDHGAGEILTGGAGDDVIRFASTTPGQTLVLAPGVTEVERVVIGTAAGVTTGTTALNVDASAVGSGLSMIGNAGANVLTGTAFDDGLTGNAGNDQLIGGAGNDQLDGGLGADTLIGGKDDDTYVIDNVGDSVTEASNEGNDTVKVTYSNSTATVATLSLSPGLVPPVPTGAQGLAGVVFGAGAVGLPLLTIVVAAPDQSFAEVENLTVTGAGLFNLVGSEADNVLIGNSSGNVLWGLGGSDTLAGGAGNDTIIGGEGDDTLNGGAGADKLQGGIGNDVMLLNSVAEFASGEVMDGGDGIDTLRYTGTTAATLILTNRVTSIEEVQIADAAGDAGGTAASNVNAAPVTSNGLTLVGNNGANVLTGTSQADILIGNAGNDQLNGGAGDDALIGGAGADRLTGGGGKDLFVYSVASDSTPSAMDVITGFTQGDDQIDLRPLGMDDLFFAGLTPTVHGVWYQQSGTNTFVLVDVNGNTTPDLKIQLTGLLSLNDADFLGDLPPLFTDTADTVDFNVVVAGTYIAGTQYDALGGDDNVMLPSNGAAALAAGFDPIRTFHGGAGNDTITGGSLSDILDGGAGSDTMTGGLGDDVFLVDNYGDSLFENTNGGTDTVRSSVDFTLPDNIENLVLLPGSYAYVGTGNELNNTITGNDNRCNLYGGVGDDLLLGGSSDDFLFGGLGSDTLIGGALNDWMDGGLGADTLIGGTGDDFYQIDNPGDSITEQAGEGTDQAQCGITYTLSANIENLNLIGEDAINGTGNDLANMLAGNSAANILTGGAGNDTVEGWGGADTLIGGTGDDTVIGGSGNDTFLFTRGDGQDLTQDNSGTADKLGFDAGINPLDLVLSRQANNLRLAVHNSTDSVTIQNWYTSPTTNQIETIQASNGQQLLNTQVDQLIQAMAAFSQQNGGITWDQAIDQNPQGVQAVLAANGWQ